MAIKVLKNGGNIDKTVAIRVDQEDRGRVTIRAGDEEKVTLENNAKMEFAQIGSNNLPMSWIKVTGSQFII